MKLLDFEKASPLYNAVKSLNRDMIQLMAFGDQLPIDSIVTIQINNKVSGTIQMDDLTGSYGHVLIESLLDHKREKLNQLKSELESI